jgi:SsrA-binding protein
MIIGSLGGGAQSMATDKAPVIKVLCANRKARHEYHIEDTLEAGLVLVGSEVKSLREGRATLVDGYATVRKGEAFLVGAQISEYPWANQFNHTPRRERKLLLHGAEIRKLEALSREKGYTVVALEIYLKGSKIKVKLGLAKGKQQHDKRASTKERELDREVARVMRRG